ncbi:uncharacterized protein BDZ99DRAFT_108701 [Mytilinidion resinicola]|uniref:RNase III domain-containing protein n=1 Tax=Mytilinidion resinicola TaxID=574789 RepID=A0A6A6YC13_9PEZI|nr:uncharacterized protein BDZ99DRAFT_108701 [Mytilinidion resinicola]KAF2805635.1 hypothetical protein BDZ99DRAFT_108701 [Mytilinidion resinicola]
MNDIVSSIELNENLNTVGHRLCRLADFINKNPSQGHAVPRKTMADTVEAILGAIFLDSDLDNVARVMRNIALTV